MATQADVTSFGILVEVPGPSEDCSPGIGTATSSTPQGVVAASNNSPTFSMQSSLPRQTLKSFSVSQIDASSVTLALSTASCTRTPIPGPTSSASITIANLDQTSSTPISTSPLSRSISEMRMASARISLGRIPHSSISSADVWSTNPSNPSTSMFSSTPTPTYDADSSSSFWQDMNSGAQSGIIIGLSILALVLIFIVLFLLDRRKRRLIPRLKTPTFNPKTTIDSSGIRWPEKVTLYGDAKAYHSWTGQYEKERRFRRSLREGEYRIETGKLGGS